MDDPIRDDDDVSEITYILAFDGGRHDGLKFPWPADAGYFPCAITFDEVIMDSQPEPGMDMKEIVRIALSAKPVAILCHRYHYVGFVIDNQDESVEVHTGLYDHIQSTEKPPESMDLP